MARKRILVLSGGAPNLTLMSGALLALHDCGLTFDAISMSGAGAVVGLSYLAPKGLTPAEALRNTINFGVSDAIYSVFPLNYKMFFKDGPLAEAFRNYWRKLPPVWQAEHQYCMSPAQKLEADLLLLAGSLITPSELTFFSEGLCAHIPFIEDIIDFKKLNQIVSPHCFLNAYRIDAEKIVEFRGKEITIDHFRAAFSFPYLYAPYEINAALYYEGAEFTGLNLLSLADNLKIPYVDRVDENAYRFIIMDALGTNVIHPSRNIMDAYGQSIIFPSVGNAEKELALFKEWVKTGDSAIIPPAERFLIAEAQRAAAYAKKKKESLESMALSNLKRIESLPANRDNFADVLRVAEAAAAAAIDAASNFSKALTAQPQVPDVEQPYPVGFLIPPEQQPYVLDWSRSNLECLFDIGYESGRIFLQEYPDIRNP